MPDLGWAYFYTGDERYAALLAAMFDRLADLYPGWPLWMPYGRSHGFALNRAGNGILTRAEYDAAPRPLRWGTQFWNTFARSYEMGHTKMGDLLPHYAMGRTAGLVKAYGAIQGSAALRRYSQDRYGDPERASAHILRDFFEEDAKLHKCYQPWLGNYTTAWLEGGIFLSLVTQDRYFFDVANALMERTLYDESFYDNATDQGSLAYWTMVLYPIVKAFQLRQVLYQPDVVAQHPRLKYLLPEPTTMQQTLASYRWILPAFGDTWNSLYPTGERPGTRPPDSWQSTHLPDYGVSMLRWAPAEGRHQEACLLYQRVVGHNHFDSLNLEYFVDGLPLFWDMGYGNGTADTSLARHPEWKELYEAGYPRPFLDTTHFYQDGKGAIPTGHWWSDEWNHRTVAHCTVKVDEKEPLTFSDPAPAGQPVTLFSSTDQNSPQRLLEVLDVAERGAFPQQEGPRVSEYRRALLTVTTPSGGGYAVDIFRVTGGKMHEFFYHAVSEQATGDLPAGKSLPGTLASYRQVTLSQPGKMKEIEAPGVLQTTRWSQGYRYIQDLSRLDSEPPAWKLQWRCDPGLYAPRTAVARANAAALLAQQKPVTLNVHGVRQPGSETVAWLWRARGLLTGHLHEVLKDGTRVEGMNGTAGFVGGLDMLIEERQGEAGLRSVFVHVLEGHRAGLPDEVLSAANLPCQVRPEGAVALKIQLVGGYTDYVFCLREPGAVTGEGFRFSGRYGLVRTDAAGKVVGASLVRSTEAAVGNWRLAGAAEYRAETVAFEGDLTGDRNRAAVIVRTSQRLPEGTALAGRSLQILSPDGWSDVFFIASVSAAGPGQYRLALQHEPTWIVDFLTVGAPDAKNPRAFYPQENDLSKSFYGALYGYNLTLIRERDGRSFGADLVFAGTSGARQRIVLHPDEPTFAESGLQPEDRAVLIRHLPGDRVIIPNVQTYAGP